MEVGAGTGGGGCLHRTKVLAKGVGTWTLKLGMPCVHHAKSNTGRSSPRRVLYLVILNPNGVLESPGKL